MILNVFFLNHFSEYLDGYLHGKCHFKFQFCFGTLPLEPLQAYSSWLGELSSSGGGRRHNTGSSAQKEGAHKMHAWPLEGIFWGPGRAEGGWQLDEEKADQDDLHVGEGVHRLSFTPNYFAPSWCIARHHVCGQLETPIRDGGSTTLYAAYPADTVDTVTLLVLSTLLTLLTLLILHDRVSEKKQKFELWNVTYPSFFHRLDEPPENFSIIDP